MYKVEKLFKGAYLVNFDDQYQMCMHFLRYQEFYESPGDQFRGKKFTLIDFMEWYSKKFGDGAFTYSVDWGGFNHPGDTIEKVHALGIDDLNKYDVEMLKISNQIRKKTKEKFYIIGSLGKGKNSALNHEISHALYYLDGAYKEEMDALTAKMSKKSREMLFKYLERIGYTKEVFWDENQAYMATGLMENLKKYKSLTKATAPFEAVFAKYTKGKLL
jgi:hypothetical protein